MKSRISFCDSTVLKKNLTRFAPAWVLYGVFWLLLLVIMLDSNGSGKWFAYSMAESLTFTAVFNFCYAFLCAQLLFGDLYNSRMCNAQHAMPLRRETWFFTHVISGLIFSFGPNVLIMLLSSVFMENAFVVAPLWLLIVTLQFLFFFGVAVFSAYCVGNRFAMGLVYLIINFLSMILFWLLDNLYVPQLYGIRIDETPFTWFCPVFYMVSEPTVDLSFSEFNQLTAIFLEAGFWYTLLCAGIGLVFMALALLLYRKRNLESAGDFMAIRAFNPVFLLLYCLCVGTVCYLFFSLSIGEENLFFLLVGLIIGWFTGRMLLERTIRVFRLKSFLGCGALLLVFFCSLLLTRLDPIGITRWIPEANAIKGVHITTGGSRYDYYTNGTNYLSDPADIDAVLTLHRYGTTHRDANVNGKPDVSITIRYELKTGIVATRYYSVDTDTVEATVLENLMSRSNVVLGTELIDGASIAESLVMIRTPQDKILTGAEMEGLLDAILLDCAEGNLAQDWAFHADENSLWLTLEWKTDKAYTHYREVRVYPSSVHTYAYLLEHGLIGAEDYK